MRCNISNICYSQENRKHGIQEMVDPTEQRSKGNPQYDSCLQVWRAASPLWSGAEVYQETT